jgi:hypothetical protein
MPPQGIWRSVQAQVPATQSQRRDTQSPDHEHVAPAGPQAVPAMVKGQLPASTVMALASAAGPGVPPVGPTVPGPPPVAAPPLGPVTVVPPEPAKEGGVVPPEPPWEPSPPP